MEHISNLKLPLPYMVFIKGYLIGLSMIIFIGPVLFFLLKSTLDLGIKSGIMAATGIIVSDILCVAICSLGAIPFFENLDNQFWISIAGCTILIFLGLKYVIKPNVNNNLNKYSYNHFSTFLQGFLINFVNPFVFLVWIGIIGYANTNFKSNLDFTIFILAILAGIFSTDIFKVFFAHHIKRFINPLFLTRIYKVFGILLIIFGFRMLFYVL